MGTSNLKESLLNKKVIILVVSLFLTAGMMRIFSPPKKLDARLFYTAIEAKEYLASLSPEQIHNYFIAEMFDFWFMINYSWILFLGLRKRWALMTGVLDFFETSLIVYYLEAQQFTSFHELLPWISTVKWLTGYGLSLLLIKKGYKLLKS